MTTNIDILKNVLQLLEDGETVALCTVIEKKGSGPRDAGAKMVVTKKWKGYRDDWWWKLRKDNC